jgi:hypothetical protein
VTPTTVTPKVAAATIDSTATEVTIRFPPRPIRLFVPTAFDLRLFHLAVLLVEPARLGDLLTMTGPHPGVKEQRVACG